MGTYTDTYVEMLQQDLQPPYWRQAPQAGHVVGPMHTNNLGA